jgi:hypothetical protein
VGAWGEDSFDNDTAVDWAAGFVEQEDIAPVQAALDEVFRQGPIDASVACEALVAAEVISRLLGRWGRRDAYSEQVDKWVEQHPQRPPQPLIDRALAAIDRIVATSELAELWEDDPEWIASVANLRECLSLLPLPG